VGKEERQNSNCGINFSQNSKGMGELFAEGKRNVPSIVFCVKIWITNNILGIFVLRRTKIRFPIVVCEKCEVFRISGSSFFKFCGFSKWPMRV
jgi:hypothetical protein